jgi:hypothetical protein
VPSELVAKVFRRDDRQEPGRFYWFEGMPTDARILGGTYIAEYDEFEFTVESPTFPEVRPGAMAGRFYLQCSWEEARIVRAST